MGRSHGIRVEKTSLSAASVSGIKAARTMLIGSSKEQENLPADAKRECRKPEGQGREYRSGGVGAD
ncbi:hypothetical protein [Tenuifilum osseticum]|uniref:hypothetical protein n=1 Tax=Tenuifilum osseticum TaxID=3374723 RepID=UPI0034E5C89E